MPTSHLYQLNQITEAITFLQPKSVLDIGVGFGKYGLLMREYLEIWGENGNYSNWKVKIDGVEIYESYILPHHHHIYNEIFIGNVLDILPKNNHKYDLILLIDVLEHFTYEDGIKLLEHCQKQADNIIISTPWDIGTQGECFDNKYEKHLFQWKKEHFRKFQEAYFFPNSNSLLCFMGSDFKRIIPKMKKHYLKRSFKEVLHVLFGFTVLKRIKT